MSRQARVGLFTLLGIIGLAWIYYVISNIGERAAGYKIAVHFASAAGLRPAALVYLSGVSIGVVDAINLRKDFSTDVIIAIRKNVDIPVGSEFVINAPLTGEPNLQIVPPKRKLGQPWPPPVLSRDLAQEQQEMPQGTNPATLTDLLEEGQGEVQRVSRMLRQLEVVEPELLAQFQETLRNANQLTRTASASLAQLSGQASDLTSSLQHTVNLAGGNVVDLSATLNTTATSGSKKINSLLASLDSTAQSLSASVDSLHSLASNPQISQNLIATTKSIAQTTQTLADLTNDLRQVTGNAATQAQLRDTVAQLDAASQKANSLLAELGGTSNVYGVDAGATPPSGATPPPGVAPVPGASPPLPGSPSGGKPEAASGTNLPGAFKNKVGQIVGNVASVQVRVSVVSPQRTGTPGAKSPLLTSDQGPQSDFNLLLLPNGRTALFTGANDIGYNNTTWNLAILQRMGQARIGGGVIYSQLGLMGGIHGLHTGFDARLYDLRHPTLDAYGNLNLTQHLQLFGGERDIFYPDRRTVFGLQAQL